MFTLLAFFALAVLISAAMIGSGAQTGKTAPKPAARQGASPPPLRVPDKGELGELLVIETVLKHLDPTTYRHYHDLYLPRPGGEGTTQIDHVVVSPFGIFVIETKNYQGWIFGSARQSHWTQQIFRSKHRFLNPLRQNYLHVKALEEYLRLKEECFHSVVFFVGGAEIKTPMPPNVLDRDLLPWIQGHTTAILDTGILNLARSRLDSLSELTDRTTAARDHLVALQARVA